MENKKDFFNRVSDYYSGEGDQEALKTDLTKDHEENRLFQWIDRFWTSLVPKTNNVDRIREKTIRKIEQADRPPQNFRIRVMKYAAVVFLALGIGSILYYYSSSREDVRMIQALSGIGQVKIIDLPDGSKAWLNAQSTITYPEKFVGDRRDIRIDGEVYLEVKHDQEHPFVVHSEYVNVKVLGTSFMISSYDEDPIVGTYLALGSIEMEVPGINKTMKLIPGDEVSYEKATQSITCKHHSGTDIDSWRFGRISFYNEPLTNIARKLERKFGVEIQIPDKNIQNMKYTVDFDTERLEQILNFLSEGSSIRYKKTGTVYMIIEK